MATGTASETPRQATREEMRDAKLPMAYRDSCGHLLIPLNRCRQDTYYLPWKCNVRTPPRLLFQLTQPAPNPSRRGDERHSYEKCQYVEFKKRVAKMDELREAKGGARSN
ncbi:NADH-ubiquinone oxidoreductase B18 subunit-domain-containing protein [Cercophora samala]|uniref:NADH dehydrogenase [ubiquinone] 1 beta subcomplex subunit 7 n=1 Tax=Cercophora samala TaxID=330535 RepID=A0AA39ZJT3_9PEZI|nr:NADH-ubiquinone oxidoreductase B18 subunit-domain-containing protein [Cercophora samala]